MPYITADNLISDRLWSLGGVSCRSGTWARTFARRFRPQVLSGELSALMEKSLTDLPTDVVNAASRWLRRRKAENFDDWAGLDSWIKSDPIHIRAYKLVIEEDEHQRVANGEPAVGLGGQSNVIPFPGRAKG